MADEHSGTEEALEARVRALEDRVAALESVGTVAGAPRASSRGDGPAGGPLWALDGLRERTDADGAVMLVGTVRLPDGREAQWQLGAPTTELLSGDWDGQAVALSALGHPTRLRLLKLVLTGTASAAALTEAAGEGTTGRTYHHLRQLVSGGWLRTTAGGRYEVPVERVVPLLATVMAARG